MTITRRKLLVGAAALAGAAGAVGLYEARNLLPKLRAAASPPLPAGAPGPLDPPLRATLLAAVEILLGRFAKTDDRSPYRRLLDSRAEEVPGYRELYRRFERAADREAAAAGAPSFAEASPAVRREVLATLCPPGRLARLRAGLTTPDRARFRLYVAQEILDLYAATGAWIALGYDAPPGDSQGIEAYSEPPVGAGARAPEGAS